MKRVIILVLVGLALQVEPAEAIVATNAPTDPTVTATKSGEIWRKRKRKNQRKGFMWGLFRKKSGCGCPK